jgi:hypothetical protein
VNHEQISGNNLTLDSLKGSLREGEFGSISPRSDLPPYHQSSGFGSTLLSGHSTLLEIHLYSSSSVEKVNRCSDHLHVRFPFILPPSQPFVEPASKRYDTSHHRSGGNKSLKELAEQSNPSMLGDPVSLKAETSDNEPTEEDRGASQTEKQEGAVKDVGMQRDYRFRSGLRAPSVHTILPAVQCSFS